VLLFRECVWFAGCGSSGNSGTALSTLNLSTLNASVQVEYRERERERDFIRKQYTFHASCALDTIHTSSLVDTQTCIDHAETQAGISRPIARSAGGDGERGWGVGGEKERESE